MAGLSQAIAQTLFKMNPSLRAPSPMLSQSIAGAVMPSYGMRIDNTPKATGFFGPLQTPYGTTATEVSVGVNFDGQEQLIPSLVPTLTQEEINTVLSLKPEQKMPKNILDKAVSHARQRIGQGLSPFASNEESRVSNQKSPQWLATQQALSQQASQAGLPTFTATPENSSARLQLMDAISRVKAAGIPVKHFIGLPNEPLGDRGVAMDIENLVGALRVQEQQAGQAGDILSLQRISQERAYWEKELADSMTAQEWKAQTGEADPVYPK